MYNAYCVVLKPLNNVFLTKSLSQRLCHIFLTKSFSQRNTHKVFLTSSFSQRNAHNVILTTSFSQRFSDNFILTTLSFLIYIYMNIHVCFFRLSHNVFLTPLLLHCTYSSTQRSPHNITIYAYCFCAVHKSQNISYLSKFRPRNFDIFLFIKLKPRRCTSAIYYLSLWEVSEP